MKIVKIVKWLEVPAPEGDPPGWYYYYDLGEAVLTEEHGPFPTREAALADAKAGLPAGWMAHEFTEGETMIYELSITGRTVNDAMLIAHRNGAKLINVKFPAKAAPVATIEGTLKAVAATAREMTA